MVVGRGGEDVEASSNFGELGRGAGGESTATVGSTAGVAFGSIILVEAVSGKGGVLVESGEGSLEAGRGVVPVENRELEEELEILWGFGPTGPVNAEGV